MMQKEKAYNQSQREMLKNKEIHKMLSRKSTKFWDEIEKVENYLKQKLKELTNEKLKKEKMISLKYFKLPDEQSLACLSIDEKKAFFEI